MDKSSQFFNIFDPVAFKKFIHIKFLPVQEQFGTRLKVYVPRIFFGSDGRIWQG
jgi:hypothetical protein